MKDTLYFVNLKVLFFWCIKLRLVWEGGGGGCNGIKEIDVIFICHHLWLSGGYRLLLILPKLTEHQTFQFSAAVGMDYMSNFEFDTISIFFHWKYRYNIDIFRGKKFDYVSNSKFLISPITTWNFIHLICKAKTKILKESEEAQVYTK